MILVTGASGTVGTSTVNALKAAGRRFKVGLRSPDKAAALGVEGVAFDWDKPGTYGPALAGIETLFLLTPVSDKQVQYTKELTAAAKRAGVRRVVKLSVIGAEADPGIALGQLHRDSENAIKAAGLTYTFLRPTFFMQNFINFYGVSATADSTVYLPNGDGKVSWIDARDIGDVAAAVLTKPGHEGKIYDLTGGEALSTAEATSILSEALGRKVSYVNVPEDAARQAMKGQGMPDWLIAGFLELNMIIRNGWSAGIQPGVREVLDRAPRTFRQFAADLAKGAGAV